MELIRVQELTKETKEKPESSCGTEQRPSMTKGRWSNQSGPANQAFREDFREPWNCSTRPLD